MGELNGRLLLAPMAGSTDAAFRTICAEMGAAGTFTEMVSAKALCYNDLKTRELLTVEDAHRPCFAQIFGSEPDVMAKGARLALEISGADGIDINMGCPVPKIVKNGEGSALMRDPDAAARIVEAVKAAVSCPVSVKFRRGFYEDENVAASFGLAIQKAGADAVTVHGRTRAQMYSGPSDRECIKQTKQALSIPVAASGDVWTRQDARDILAQTGADRVMAARGALGNPFIFRQDEAPDEAEVLDVMRRHIESMCAHKGEAKGCAEGRQQALWYLSRFRSAAAYKRRAACIKTLDELYELIKIMTVEGARLKPWKKS